MFSEIEKEIQKEWEKNNIITELLQQQENKESFIFFDGPPFATGLPHYGHLLASTIKDTIVRYKTMEGYKIERKFGFDCHGLPVEYEINKKLGIVSSKDIDVCVYNKECRSIVKKYVSEWQEFLNRIGRWTDPSGYYFTMNNDYMNNIWKVFALLYKKGLIYKEYKVMPFSTALNCPLSNFEVSQNYKEVHDISIYVLFEIDNNDLFSLESPVYFLVWTTTPWTLPANMAICINPELNYKLVKENNKYIIMNEMYANKINIKDIIKTFKGFELSTLTYKSLFTQNHYPIILDTYVKNDIGTGLIHCAPLYGEDDYRVYKNMNNIMNCINHINNEGLFIYNEIMDNSLKQYNGIYFKDLDKEICNILKEKSLLYKKEQYYHSYPYCWRSDTPLIYKTIDSWFLKVTDIKEDLCKNNEQIYWNPDSVKNRFSNWLSNCCDWNISRNRYWGTPIPIWISSDNDILVISSKEELEELSGQKVEDLHKEFIDSIIITKNGKIYKRIPEVFDCWFESGAMPYSTNNIFNSIDFNSADFIAEGIDQTRGWFYTLLVLSTALFNKPAFKNVIVNGIVLANDGKKMSKKLKNYPDINEIFNKYGTDAVRLYLLNSPLVKGEEMNFNENGIKDMVKVILIPLHNILNLIDNYGNENDEKKVNNFLIKWFDNKLNILKNEIKNEINIYTLHTIIPKIIKIIDILQNWIIKLLKDDFKNGNIYFLKLFMLKLSIILAPFMPFYSDYIFSQNELSKHLLKSNSKSVHLLIEKDYNHLFIQSEDSEVIIESTEWTRTLSTEEDIYLLQNIIEQIRKIRDIYKIQRRMPLYKLTIITSNPLNNNIINFIQKESNIKNIDFVYYNKDNYNDYFNCQIQLSITGIKKCKKLKNQVEIQLTQQIIFNNQSLLDNFNKNNTYGIILTQDDITFKITAKKEDTVLINNNILIQLDLNIYEELKNEFIINELIFNIQQFRKELKLIPKDDIIIYYVVLQGNQQLIENNINNISNIIKKPFMQLNNQLNTDNMKIKSFSIFEPTPFLSDKQPKEYKFHIYIT